MAQEETVIQIEVDKFTYRILQKAWEEILAKPLPKDFINLEFRGFDPLTKNLVRISIWEEGKITELFS